MKHDIINGFISVMVSSICMTFTGAQVNYPITCLYLVGDSLGESVLGQEKVAIQVMMMMMMMLMVGGCVGTGGGSCGGAREVLQTVRQ